MKIVSFCFFFINTTIHSVNPSLSLFVIHNQSSLHDMRSDCVSNRFVFWSRTTYTARERRRETNALFISFCRIPIHKHKIEYKFTVTQAMLQRVCLCVPNERARNYMDRSHSVISAFESVFPTKKDAIQKCLFSVAIFNLARQSFIFIKRIFPKQSKGDSFEIWF